jgi:hypothetical protein
LDNTDNNLYYNEEKNLQPFEHNFQRLGVNSYGDNGMIATNIFDTSQATEDDTNKSRIYGLHSIPDVWHSFPTKSAIVLQSAAFVFV